MPNELPVALGNAAIDDPFGTGERYALMLGDVTAAAASFLYVPESEAPGLGIDLLRIDVTGRSPMTPGGVARAYRRRLLQRTPDAGFKVLRDDSQQAVFETNTGNALLPGFSQSIVRYLRLPRFDVSLQVIRKLVPWTDDERSARMSFLGRPVDAAAIVPGFTPACGEFAARAQGTSKKLAAWLQRLRTPADATEAALAELLRDLRAASPFHDALSWSLLASLHAKLVLEDGSPEQSDAALRPLELALFHFDDRAEDAFFADRLSDAAAALGKLLMLAPSGPLTRPIGRAPALLRAAAARTGTPVARLSNLLRAELADLLARPDEAAPLDARLPPPVRSALLDKATLESVIVDLRGDAWQAMRLAGRGHVAMYRLARLAIDLGITLWARLVEFGDFVPYSAESMRLAQDTIAVQRATFGLTFDQMARFIRQHPGLFGPKDATRPLLLYLRPLVTALRIPLRNRFPWHAGLPDASFRAALETLNIEAALHLAFVTMFETYSIGGIPDLFGMQRDQIVKSGDTEGSAWREGVKPLIGMASVVVVLAGDSEGLRWEIAEIGRQQAFGRMLLVVPPGAPSPEILQASLAGSGIDVDLSDLAPGFLALTGRGTLSRRFEFDDLWSGALRDSVLEGVVARG